MTSNQRRLLSLKWRNFQSYMSSIFNTSVLKPTCKHLAHACACIQSISSAKARVWLHSSLHETTDLTWGMIKLLSCPELTELSWQTRLKSYQRTQSLNTCKSIWRRSRRSGLGTMKRLVRSSLRSWPDPLYSLTRCDRALITTMTTMVTSTAWKRSSSKVFSAVELWVSQEDKSIQCRTLACRLGLDLARKETLSQVGES